MADISNKTLALLVGVAIVVSVVGIFVAQEGAQITGYGTTETGVVNLTIAASVSINVTGDIEFGVGTVAGTTQDFADLFSNNGTVRGGNWTFSSQFITIENDGTVNVTLNVRSDKNATGFIGGGIEGTENEPRFEFFIQNQEDDSCAFIKNGSAFGVGNFTNYNGTGNEELVVCNSFDFSSASDLLNFSTFVRVPITAPTGLKTATVTFTAAQI